MASSGTIDDIDARSGDAASVGRGAEEEAFGAYGDHDGTGTNFRENRWRTVMTALLWELPVGIRSESQSEMHDRAQWIPG